MQKIVTHIIRFILLILLQGLVFGQIELSWGIHPMIYPLIILLLPFETTPIVLMLVGFTAGISVDFFMNTFGLHASAGALIGYLRPELFKLFAPRDGYDVMREPTADYLGYQWFISVSSILIVVHHLWFFLLEYFKLSAWPFILQKTLLSSMVTLLIFILIQVFFFKKTRSQ